METSPTEVEPQVLTIGPVMLALHLSKGRESWEENSQAVAFQSLSTSCERIFFPCPCPGIWNPPSC